ncbi:MAG: hypothetical protein AAF316_04485 [Cyanobacteria bacterium P01_A01_bin.80]
MDTPENFKFLIESVAEQHNPYQEGEYLVIKTYPREKRLMVEKRSFDYDEAKRYCELEDFSHDYTSFGLRIFHQGKLYKVIKNGKPGEISRQQDWKINSNYLEAHYDQNTDGEIVVCNCSYSYFSALVLYLTIDNEPSEKWQPVTCLIDDEGREIDNCPNCGTQLVKYDDDDEDYDEDEEDYVPPAACNGCSNYHGQVYNNNLLVCAIHPHGFDNVSCPDFT